MLPENWPQEGPCGGHIMYWFSEIRGHHARAKPKTSLPHEKEIAMRWPMNKTAHLIKT